MFNTIELFITGVKLFWMWWSFDDTYDEITDLYFGLFIL